MNYLDFNIWNFAFYNGLGIAALMVLGLYAVFMYEKIKKKEFDWSFEFSTGIFIATISTVIERSYYGTLRAMKLAEVKDTEELLSPSPIISIIAIVGVIGLLYHVRSMTRYRFKNGILKGALWVTFGVICASAVWGFLL